MCAQRTSYDLLASIMNNTLTFSMLSGTIYFLQFINYLIYEAIIVVRLSTFVICRERTFF